VIGFPIGRLRFSRMKNGIEEENDAEESEEDNDCNKI
jgi:hypothetical protein